MQNVGGIYISKKYGNWIIEKSLSEGGQGHIFLVKDETNENRGTCVLKRLKNIKRVDRFRNEIEAGLKLKYPNIVEVIDYNLDTEKPFMVTNYYENGPLSEMDLTEYSILEKLEIFKQISLAVGYAHENDVIHRDLKPENIFLQDLETPIIGDFGICFFNDQKNERSTITDEAVGPYFYMAPELEDGRSEDINACSDIYSLGKILYWLISNGKKFAREKHRNSNFDISQNPEFPEIDLIYEYLDKMIAADPLKRYKNGTDLFNAVKILIRRIKMNAHVTNLNIPQLCTYCGLGYYKRAASYHKDKEGKIQQNWSALDNFGIPRRGYWIILVCENCGHTQTFHPGYTDQYKNPEQYEKWIEEK